MIFPIKFGVNPILGAMSFDMIRKEISWNDEIVNRLSLVVQIFANSLYRLHGVQRMWDSEERFKIMMENLPNTVEISDAEGIVRYWSPNNEQLFGMKAEEIFGKNGRELPHPQDQDRLYQRLVELKEAGDGAILADSFRFLRKDGVKIIVEMRVKNLLNHRLIKGFLISYKDITEQKLFERRMLEEAERYQTLIESTDDLIWVVEPVNYGLVNFNSALRKHFLTGQGLEIKTGMTPDDLLPKNYARGWHNMYSRTIRNGPFKTIYRTSAKGKVIMLSLYPLLIDEELIGISVFGQDITQHKALETQLQKNQQQLEISNKMLERRLQQSLNAISKIGELRDGYTAGHQRKVAELACAIARDMGLSEEVISNIACGALIHDIGKIYIGSDILNKPGKITDLEYQILQTHAEYGYEIVKEIDFPAAVHMMIRQHHEWLDGTGYPKGLEGADIILESRIITVADVVEAIASHRPYRPALGIEFALEEIITYRGIRYDEKIVDICVSLFREKGFAFGLAEKFFGGG